MINVAQIGVGYWGPNLLRNIDSNSGCKLLKVADLIEERQNFVRSKYPNVEVTGDIDEILFDPDIQAIVISTPVKSHFELAKMALNNNKHVLVEKPLATSVEEVEVLEKIANEKSLLVMVGHTFLYNSAVRHIKKLIDSNYLGDIRYIYSQRLNLGRIRNDVDAFWNLAPHDISIIQYWLDDISPISVDKTGMSYIQKDIHDVVFATLKYPNSVLANIHVSWLDPNKIRKMVIVGSKKMVVYDDVSDDKITIYDKGIDKYAIIGKDMDFDNIEKFGYKHRDGEMEKPKISWEEPLKVEIDHFIDCIDKGRDSITGISHAKEVVRILSME